MPVTITGGDLMALIMYYTLELKGALAYFSLTFFDVEILIIIGF